MLVNADLISLPEAVNELVNIGLQFCPKLTSLEIIEIEQQRGEYLSRIKSILMYIDVHFY